MREIINNNNVIFGLVFSLFSGYFFFKSVKRLIKEYNDEDWSLYSSTLSIVVGWFALFGGSIGLLIGNNLF